MAVKASILKRLVTQLERKGMSHQLQAALSNAARQSVETGFGSISLN